MMHKLTRLAVSAVFVSALNACMTGGGNFDPPKVDLLTPGVSTREDATNLLGAAKPQAAALHVGEMVMLICAGAGDVAKTPMLTTRGVWRLARRGSRATVGTRLRTHAARAAVNAGREQYHFHVETPSRAN